MLRQIQRIPQVKSEMSIDAFTNLISYVAHDLGASSLMAPKICNDCHKVSRPLHFVDPDYHASNVTCGDCITCRLTDEPAEKYESYDADKTASLEPELLVLWQAAKSRLDQWLAAMTNGSGFDSISIEETLNSKLATTFINL